MHAALSNAMTREGRLGDHIMAQIAFADACKQVIPLDFICTWQLLRNGG